MRIGWQSPAEKCLMILGVGKPQKNCDAHRNQQALVAHESPKGPPSHISGALHEVAPPGVEGNQDSLSLSRGYELKASTSSSAHATEDDR
jgi:hypothetical protein